MTTTHGFGNLSTWGTSWTGRNVPYRGTYINLDQSLGRRQAMERQFQALNLSERYARLPAVDAASLPASAGTISAGELGCFKSHCLALERSKGNGAGIHVLEDDVVLSPFVAPAIEAMQADGTLERFDIVFTDTFVGLEPFRLKQYKQWFEQASQKRSLGNSSPFGVLDISSSYIACTPSYVVGANAIDRVLQVYKKGLDCPTSPLDIWIRNEAVAGRLRLGCVFPFITTFQIGAGSETTIAGRADGARFSRAVCDLLRYSFFIDRDLVNVPRALLGEMQAKKLRRGTDVHMELIVSVLEHVISNDYSPF